MELTARFKKRPNNFSFVILSHFCGNGQQFATCIMLQIWFETEVKKIYFLQKLQ